MVRRTVLFQFGWFNVCVSAHVSSAADEQRNEQTPQNLPIKTGAHITLIIITRSKFVSIISSRLHQTVSALT